MSEMGGNADMMGNRSAIDAVINTRISDHQSFIRAYPRPADLSHHPLNILADGDSWFDYPYGGPAPHLHSDITRKLGGYRKLGGQLIDGSSILNLAHFGNTAEELMKGRLRERLATMMGDKANGTFDAIMFSGGGNDLAGDQFEKWLRKYDDVGGDPEQGLDEDALQGVLTKVRDAYIDLISLRNEIVPEVPIFVHGYDFAWPTGKRAFCAGPWLRPGLRTKGWDIGDEFQVVQRGARIVAKMLGRFAIMLEKLADDQNNNLVLIPTQALLDPQTEWANELHPTPDGFARVAALFAAALTTQFPGRPVLANLALNA